MKTHRTHRPRRTAAIVLIAISAFMTSFIIIWCANGVMDFLNYLGINQSLGPATTLRLDARRSYGSRIHPLYGPNDT